MTTPPDQPKIYHITHVDNLNSLSRDGWIMSDRLMVARGGPPVSIGMPNIKAARLQKEVPLYPGRTVGDFVPFNFCPRSVMLFLINCANAPGLQYRLGQTRIVHMELDLNSVLDWADAHSIPWALTTSNARSGYTPFHDKREDINAIDWSAVANNDFRDPFVKDSKQAELLVLDRVPWELVQVIGVRSVPVAAEATAGLEGAAHQPPVIVVRDWYF